jgi:hypothetical protein
VGGRRRTLRHEQTAWVHGRRREGCLFSSDRPRSFCGVKDKHCAGALHHVTARDCVPRHTHPSAITSQSTSLSLNAAHAASCRSLSCTHTHTHTRARAHSLFAHACSFGHTSAPLALISYIRDGQEEQAPPPPPRNASDADEAAKKPGPPVVAKRVRDA